jgi:hypothetical protein
VKDQGESLWSKVEAGATIRDMGDLKEGEEVENVAQWGLPAVTMIR